MDSLNNITIFRFAHILRKPFAGGVETYLYDLNRRLLERNQMRIIQMYLAPDDEAPGIEKKNMGQGELVWIPSTFISRNGPGGARHNALRLWNRLRSPFAPFYGVSHDLLIATLKRYEVNLALFHWISKDSKRILRYMNKKGIPFLIINHFHNERLNLRLARQFVSQAHQVAGVSNKEVPRRVKGKFINISDGIDTEFFQPQKARPIPQKVDGPIILMPSRITETKGHLDAVKAMGYLRQKGVSATLAFAGRIESDDLVKKINELITMEGLDGKVIFLGELSAEKLRDWYGASDLVLIVSYSEGLARVILEAQAMRKPVVAYDVGGISEAIRKDQTGYLVRKGDIKGVAMKSKELLEDGGKRIIMGGHGRKYILSQFTIEHLVERHEAFYLNALNNCRG